jgi:hypothetical protein
MDDEDINKKFWFNKPAESELESFLQTMVGTQISIWEKSEGTIKAEEFKILEYKSNPRQFRLEYHAGFLDKIKGSEYKDRDHDLLFKGAVAKLNIFGVGKLLYDLKSNTYTYILKDEIFKSQQRSNYRLQSSKLIRIQFKIDKTVFQGLDVSASGISLAIPANLKQNFKPGDIFRDCKLGLNQNTYEIAECKVVKATDITENIPDPKFIVALHFEHLNKNIEHKLSLDISMEARGEQIARNMKTKNK